MYVIEFHKDAIGSLLNIDHVGGQNNEISILWE